MPRGARRCRNRYSAVGLRQMLPMQTVSTRLNTAPKLPQVLDTVERSHQTAATMTSPRPSGNPGIRMHPDRPSPPKNMPPEACLSLGSSHQQTTSRGPPSLRSGPIFSTTMDARRFGKQCIVPETAVGWVPRQHLIFRVAPHAWGHRGISGHFSRRSHRAAASWGIPESTSP